MLRPLKAGLIALQYRHRRLSAFLPETPVATGEAPFGREPSNSLPS
jgi:hypothetical protein